MNMRKSPHFKFISILLIFMLSLTLCVPVFAEDESAGDTENTDITRQNDPEDKAQNDPGDSSPTDPVDPPSPSIHTVARAWDVLQDDEDSASYGSEEQPAQVFYYIEYEIDEEKEAEVERMVEEAEARDKAKAEKEAKQLAEELVANGRYKELIGEGNRYEKPWYDIDDDADPDTDDETTEDEFADDDEEDVDEDEDDDDSEDEYVDEDTEDEENIHSDGPYYSKLKDKYPHILEFWFESNGKYYYDYDVDYDGIDFDSIYIEVPHDTFHVIDAVSYKDFTAQSKYSVSAQLVRLETNESGETAAKETVKELEMNLETGDTTEGEFSLDFGELKLELGNYVILINIKDESGADYISHSDLNNNNESVLVDSFNTAFDAAVKNSASKKRGEGSITFPTASPNTGDESRTEMMLYIFTLLLSICSLSALTFIRYSHYN